MATVMFEDADEWLAELTADCDQIDRRIVRIATIRVPSPICRVFAIRVRATARVGNDLYAVECLCGALCGVVEADEQVLDQAKQLRERITSRCAIMGLHIRSGVCEETS